MKQTIEELNNEMRDGIFAVLRGDKAEFKHSNITTLMVEKHMELHGWEVGEFVTNGWQYDWWQPFTKDGKSFTAHGSGYYGTFEFRATEE